EMGLVEPPVEEGFAGWGCAVVVRGPPIFYLFAEFGDERRHEFVGGCCAEGFVGREPTNGWVEDDEGGFGEIGVEGHYRSPKGAQAGMPVPQKTKADSEPSKREGSE